MRSRPILLEMLSIVLAIVLGFAVTNWDTKRRDRARGEDAVERIRLELEANLAGLTDVAPYYRRMAEVLDSMITVDGDGTIDITYRFILFERADEPQAEGMS